MYTPDSWLAPRIPLPRVAVVEGTAVSRRELLPPLGLASVGAAAAGTPVVVDEFAEDAISTNVRIAGACFGGSGFKDVRRRTHVGEGAERSGRVESLHVGEMKIGSSRNNEDNIEGGLLW